MRPGSPEGLAGVTPRSRGRALVHPQGLLRPTWPVHTRRPQYTGRARAGVTGKPTTFLSLMIRVWAEGRGRRAPRGSIPAKAWGMPVPGVGAWWLGAAPSRLVLVSPSRPCFCCGSWDSLGASLSRTASWSLWPRQRSRSLGVLRLLAQGAPGARRGAPTSPPWQPCRGAARPIPRCGLTASGSGGDLALCVLFTTPIDYLAGFCCSGENGF